MIVAPMPLVDVPRGLGYIGGVWCSYGLLPHLRLIAWGFGLALFMPSGRNGSSV